jgi:hypothetical protein
MDLVAVYFCESSSTFSAVSVVARSSAEVVEMRTAASSAEYASRRGG